MVLADAGPADSDARLDASGGGDANGGLDGGDEFDAEDGSDSGDLSSDAGAGESCGGTVCDRRARCIDEACVCEPGTVVSNGACITADPCEQNRCYYVDSALGDDSNPGTEAEPFATLGAVHTVLPSLQPGGGVLFRRGGDWSANLLSISQLVVGTAEEPITFGSYGPPTDPLPKLQVQVEGAHHIVVRDLHGVGPADGDCFEVIGQGENLLFVDNEAGPCGTGFRIRRSRFVTIFRNAVNGVGGQGVVGLDPLEGSLWIAGNVVRNTGEEGIRFTPPAAADIKVVDNHVVGTLQAGINVGAAPGSLWVVNNTVVGSGRVAIAVAPSAEPVHVVEGNVTFGNQGGLNVTSGAVIEHNTIVETTDRPVDVGSTASAVVLRRNVYVSGLEACVQIDPFADPMEMIAESDFNWFSPPRACAISLGTDPMPIPFMGFEQQSGCGAVVGVVPPATSPADVVIDDEFLRRFVPDPAWEGCSLAGGPIGAFDCEGRRLGRVRPLSSLIENGGLGWAGPELIRFWYPL